MHRSILTASIASAAALAVAAPALAATQLEIQFSGLDFNYAGTQITDNAGAGTSGQFDGLTTASFYSDGNLVDTVTTNVFANMLVSNVTGIPAAGGSIQITTGFSFFDILFGPNSTSPRLQLNLEAPINVFYSGNGIGVATIAPASVFAESNLPFGFDFDENASVSLVFSSSRLSGVTTSGGFLTGFTASGTGNISGTAIPEPASLSVLGLAAMGLVRRRRA